MSREFTQEDFSLYPKSGRGVNFVKDESTDPHYAGSLNIEIDGFVETPHGYVKARAHKYIRDGKAVWEGTTLEFISNGRSYIRWYKKFYKRNTMVTEGKKFAKDVMIQLGSLT